MLDKTSSRAVYQGGYNQSVFPIPFPFLENSHIAAAVYDADGSRVLAAGIDYTVNRISDANGELVLLGPELRAGSTLTISRRVPLTQEIMFHNQGPNSPKATEEAVDKLTMIAQELRDAVDERLPIPDGSTAEDVYDAIAASAEQVQQFRAEVADLSSALAGKAALNHNHEISAISGLQDRLAAKADTSSVATALERKADKTELMDKASLRHRHNVSDVDGLVDSLAGKVDTDDPRLSAPGAHAASHGKTGTDPILPESIGAMSPPPADGKPYLAAAGGWIEYIAPSEGGGGGPGTLDHSQLLNRNAADQHPQSAIIHLPQDLAAIRDSVTRVDTAIQGQALLLTAKANRSELPGLATQENDGLMSVFDKRKLDSIDQDGDGLPPGGTAGSVLVRDGLNNPGWKTPLQFAESLPNMSATQSGIAKLAPGGGLVMDAEGRLGVAGASVRTISFATDGVSTAFALDHDLDTRSLMVQVFEAVTGEQVFFGVSVPTRNRVVLTANPARPAGEGYRAVIASGVPGGSGATSTTGEGLPIGRRANQILCSDESNVTRWLSGQEAANIIPAASPVSAGVMSAADKALLDGAFPGFDALDLHLHPLGDDSPYNSGAPGSPFRTLSGLFRAVSKRKSLGYGILRVHLAAGIYPVDDMVYSLPLIANRSVSIIGPNDVNRARLLLNNIHFELPGRVYFTDLDIECLNTSADAVVAGMGARLTFDGVGIVYFGSQNFFHGYGGGAFEFSGNINLYGASVGKNTIFLLTNYSMAYFQSSVFRLFDFPSFVCAVYMTNYAAMDAKGLTLYANDGISGMRYIIDWQSNVQAGGRPYLFPGTADGTAANNSIYW